jgi:Uncharacterized conserved protein (DUF2285)
MNIATEHRDDEGWHLVLSAGKRRYRLNICGETTEAEPLAYVLPGDAFWETRQAAASAFHGQLRLGQVSKLPICLVPGPSEHWRLVQWLRLLDALSAGASARELAIELIARDAGRYSAAEWDTSSERKRIARWQRQALAMRDGGYLTLLSGR